MSNPKWLVRSQSLVLESVRYKICESEAIPYGYWTIIDLIAKQSDEFFFNFHFVLLQIRK